MEKHTPKELDALAEMAYDDGDPARSEMLFEKAQALRKFEREQPLHAIAAIIESFEREKGDPVLALDEIARIVLAAILANAEAWPAR